MSGAAYLKVARYYLTVGEMKMDGHHLRDAVRFLV